MNVMVLVASGPGDAFVNARVSVDLYSKVAGLAVVTSILCADSLLTVAVKYANVAPTNATSNVATAIITKTVLLFFCFF